MIDSVNVTTLAYDARGNLVERRAENDSDNDGMVDSVNLTTFAYDPRGNLVEQRGEFDFDADG